MDDQYSLINAEEQDEGCSIFSTVLENRYLRTLFESLKRYVRRAAPTKYHPLNMVDDVGIWKGLTLDIQLPIG